MTKVTTLILLDAGLRQHDAEATGYFEVAKILRLAGRVLSVVEGLAKDNKSNDAYTTGCWPRQHDMEATTRRLSSSTIGSYLTGG